MRSSLLSTLTSFRFLLILFAASCIIFTVFLTHTLTPLYLRRESVDCFEHARLKAESELGPTTAPNARNLIVVAGHAIWTGGSQQGNADSEWYVFLLKGFDFVNER